MTVTPIHQATARRARMAPRRGASPTDSVDPAVRAEPNQWSFTIDIAVRGAADPAMLQLIRDLHMLVSAGTATPVSHPDVLAALADGYVESRALRIDGRGRMVSRAGRQIVLSRLEFDLLRFLAEHPGRVFTRQELLAAIWHDDKSGSRTVDVHVRRIRAKVGDPVIHTVRNVGYRLSQGARVELSA